MPEAITEPDAYADGYAAAKHDAEVERNTHTHKHPSAIYYSHSHPYFEPHQHAYYGPIGDTFGHAGPLSESDSLTEHGAFGYANAEHHAPTD